ncbi:hydroxymethylpyrimidine/phosphomethylpyrimidine kinase [Pilimelia terevasa]|uniref:Hydroxymethylpyrimidine/phosphomethylpyrimidine kinase n=1 Tax=Pilimelia terevasa TaxID=53372 RepID=A0A8J3BJR2_9ACTN|nr:bifunctional hydroxymethylpyrimidine kinase/phosphomethylpyrimidine kinase [Pilimelia terevasa]GGK13948.1 hydroxymethylpyrimidine/phosphomethylpyrimidine kinase [Pilimelia terevasa]
MTPPVVLTIAGSDSGGGAGIQADLKTFAAHRCYGASVLTAVTAQNTRGVTAVHPVPVEVVAAQLDAVLADLPVAAVKVGMIGDRAVAALVAARAAAGRLPHLVVDPVLVATSGDPLGAVDAVTPLLPYARVLTPNAAEAGALCGRPVRTAADAAEAARELAARGPRAVVVTGGDLDGDPVDCLWTADGGAREFPGPRVDTRNTHGTGCTFAAALAARFARDPGEGVATAVAAAKEYVARALAGARGWSIGAGHGPVDHFGWDSQGRSE